MPESWKLTLPCTRAEAQALDADIVPLALMEPPPSLVMLEEGDSWLLAAYFEGKPNAASIGLIQSLIPSAAKTKPQLERLLDEDWLMLSQQGLQPAQAGRFYVHTAAHPNVPPGSAPFRIEASQAFGTGGHETTHGCLEMLDSLKRRGMRFEEVADIGTGTGLLAFAASHLWPRARVTASDIDPVSIAVTKDNAALNGVALGTNRGQVALYTATGVDHTFILKRAPFDLVVANILAGPLIALAPSLSAVLRDGGVLILAGLLDNQIAAVAAAYRAQGCRLAEHTARGAWPCLRFTKRSRFGWQRPVRSDGGDTLPPGDFGSL